MSETDERPLLLRLETFHVDFDQFYGEPVPMMVTQICAECSDEITSLRAQLDEAKEAVKFESESVAGLARTAADLRSELDEARRKAIEQCAAIAKTYGGDCDLMISEFRALLSESKS